MKTELLSTKLNIPQNPPGMIPRSRLKALLAAGLSSPFTLLSAPAGFGKTSLLCDWLSVYPGSAAWISLDKGDNDPARFLRYLIAGIHSVAPGVTEAADSMLNVTQMGLPEIEPLLISMVNKMASLSDPIVIILDDYHLIENQEIHSAVSFLIDNAPSQLHVIISTRSDPPLPLARWRARGRMLEIRGDDLRFSSSETDIYLLQRLGQVLSVDDIAALKEKTEGWIAGLQMAVLSIQGRPDPSEFIRTFSGSQRYIMAYLMEEVLHRQTEEVQAFLLQTSLLERLNSQLCDAVTGQTGSRQRLEMLENANMFLLPLDDQRQWYRYHHLFADLLRTRLHESQPGLISTLHHRAAQWYQDNAMTTDAINHTLAAHDYQRAAGLIEEAAIPLVIRGELNTLINWREQIPPEILNDMPRVCVYLAWTFIFSGKISDAESLLDRAESRIDQGNLSEARDITGNIAALRAFMADMRGDIVQAAELARKADALIDKTNLLNRSVVPYVLARAYRLNGDMAGATARLHEVADFARAAGNIMTLSVANYDLAAILKLEGKLRQAAAVYQDTLQSASEKGARSFGSVARIDAGLSDIYREWNDLDNARRLATEAVEHMKSWRNPSDLVIAYLMLSHVQQACGEFDRAAETLSKAEHLKRNSPLFPSLRTAVETDRVKLWLAQGNLAAAGRWVEEYHPGNTEFLVLQEQELITSARILLAQGKPERALELLKDLEGDARGGGRFGELIEILILQAMAFKAQNDQPQALTALVKALHLAEPEGYLRVFIDAGTPMAELLSALSHHQVKDSGVQPIGKNYLTGLIKAFPEAPSSGITGLTDDLSKRELEILRLMARGMSNKQIAAELFITPGTVKTHIIHIYRKLDAVNRSQAVSLARDLKLLQ